MTSKSVKRKVVTVSDYRLTGRLLGKGNFAKVEEAVHNVLNVKVAVKIINVDDIKEKYVLRNLHREARILSKLNHPCIASLFQTMQMSDNVYYLVTELVSGGDLCTFIIGQRYGKLEERAAKIFARQFASALAHMHSYGIVHRDLKMENVILNSVQTQIKIVDFGLSNTWSLENPLRTHCGSPEYAAPELFIAGKTYGPEVDLWSLGIILYGMVVGQLPFVGGRKNQLSSQERRKKLVAQINQGLGASQRQAIAPMSLDFRMMLNKLLTADPVKRITTKELIVHPWITEKGRKLVKTYFFKEATPEMKSKFLGQISDLFNVDEDVITNEITKNPYGRLGGMYNILCHKHFNESFSPDNIAPNVEKESSSFFKNLARPKTTAIPSKLPESPTTEGRARSAIPTSILYKKIDRLTRGKPGEGRVKSATPIYTKINSLMINRKSQENQKNSDSTQASGPNNRRPHTTSLTKRWLSTSKQNKQEPEQICLNSKAMGDGSKKRLTTVSATMRKKKPLDDEPIARSIAYYLTKNVPEHLLNAQLMRK